MKKVLMINWDGYPNLSSGGVELTVLFDYLSASLIRGEDKEPISGYFDNLLRFIEILCHFYSRILITI
jgi:hypothetical protein